MPAFKLCMLLALAIGATPVVGCSDDDSKPMGSGGAAPSAQCEDLGELCHEAGEINADAAECHEVGHTGVASECAARFDECKALCEAILAAAGAGGMGGTGGAPSAGTGGAP